MRHEHAIKVHPHQTSKAIISAQSDSVEDCLKTSQCFIIVAAGHKMKSGANSQVHLICHLNRP